MNHISPSRPPSHAHGGFLGGLRMRMMGLRDRDVAPLLRFFEPAAPAARERLTQIVHSFVEGYNLGVACQSTEELSAALGWHDPERAGFAWEGAGMGVAVRTLLVPGSKYFADYLKSADRHHYIVHIGAGWAMARVGFRHGALKSQMCPIYHWLAWDGFGFHETMFKPKKTLEEQRGRPSLGYAGQAFDQGIGRALWFAWGARPDEVIRCIQAFSPERRADLWGGLGLAMTYAGGVSGDVLEAITKASGEHRVSLALGSALAVETRHRAGNVSDHTETAARRLIGAPASEIPPLMRRLEAELGVSDETYPRMRDQLRAHFQDR